MNHASPASRAEKEESGNRVESVFDLRERLARTLRRAADEARGNGGDEVRSAALERLAEAAREPFLLVVAGEVNSGKSTFLNALFGEEVSEADVLPATERVLWFRHGDVGKDEVLPNGVVVRKRPLAFLRDFNMVDTPGTNSVVDGHDAVTEDFVPLADLVLVVLPVTNPWAASMWRFLERLHRVWLKRVIVILQQCDLRSPEEVTTVSGHVRGRLHGAFGEVFPLFPVSALLALQARRSLEKTGDVGDLWEKSGFPEVEVYLRQHVGRFESRLLKMRNTVEAALQVLRHWPTPPHHDPELGAQEKLLEDVHRRIEECERATLVEARATGIEVIRRFREAEVFLPVMVEEQMGIAATMRATFFGERAPRRTERRFLSVLREGADSCEASLREMLAARVHVLWAELRNILLMEHGFDLPDVPGGPPEALRAWAAEVSAPVPARIDAATAKLGLAHLLSSPMRRRILWLRLILLVSGVAGGAAVWAWQNHLALGAIISASVAMVTSLLCGMFIAQQAIVPILEVTANGLEGGRGEVLRSTDAAVVQATGDLFLRLRTVFRSLEDEYERNVRLKGDRQGFPWVRRELESIAVVLDRWAAMGADAENSRLSSAQVFR